LRSHDVFDGVKAAGVEIVLWKLAAELLKRPAADTEHGERCCHGIIVSEIHFRIEIGGVLFSRVLLVKSVPRLAMR
jgi:hypothetical protein